MTTRQQSSKEMHSETFAICRRAISRKRQQQLEKMARKLPVQTRADGCLIMLIIGFILAAFSRFEPIDCLDLIRTSSGAYINHQYPYHHYQQQQQQPQQQQCSSGAPPQWRPYLDASSKAYLAPIVVVATLKEFSLLPIQLASVGGPSSSSAIAASSSLLPLLHKQQQPLGGYHPQDINNIGVYIQATFSNISVLKNTLRFVNISNTTVIRIVYQVSASLSTTRDLTQLARSNTLSPASQLQSANRLNLTPAQRQQQQHQLLGQQHQLSGGREHICSLELSEHELERKVHKIFKKNQNYILYLDQRQLLSSSNQVFYHPFATHEPLNNQTTRSLSRILCRDCAQVPQVQLLNSTFVSESLAPPPPQQQQQQLANGRNTRQPQKVKLDCRVTGYPAPWVQWFRNGKLLRNRPGRYTMRTSKWKKRHNVRLSRLEIELGSRNETGIYECRAMNVVAREPAVASYTLLEYPFNYALVPMEPPVGEFDQLLLPPPPPAEDRAPPMGHKADPQQPPPPTAAAAATTTATAAAASTTTTITPMASTSITVPTSGTSTTSRPSTVVASGGGGANYTTQPTAGPQQQQQEQVPTSTSRSTPDAGQAGTSERPTRGDGGSSSDERQQQQSGQESNGANSIENKIAGDSTPVVGQSCPPGIQDTYCMNRGTCVLIGHIHEYYCNCPEGYEGHRCESKSFGHKKAPH